MKYRKKPIEVEAFYFDKLPAGLPLWAIDCVSTGCRPFYLEIRTKSGCVETRMPTWLIREADGDGCYPCTSEMFEQLYEKVEE